MGGKNQPEIFSRSLGVYEYTYSCYGRGGKLFSFLTSQAVYYDPYLWALTYHGGRTENKFWVFEFDKVSDVDLDCYSLLEKHFEFLLRNSIPLEEFLYTPAAGSAIAYGKDYYYLYNERPGESV